MRYLSVFWVSQSYCSFLHAQRRLSWEISCKQFNLRQHKPLVFKKAATQPFPCCVICLVAITDAWYAGTMFHETTEGKSDLKDSHPYQVEKKAL